MELKPAMTYRSGGTIIILLEILGNTWSLLIVRGLVFWAHHPQQIPECGRKIATNFLSDGLQRLEAACIIEKRRNPADVRKFIYRQTARSDLAPLKCIS